jgi:hypothetical protein
MDAEKKKGRASFAAMAQWREREDSPLQSITGTALASRGLPFSAHSHIPAPLNLAWADGRHALKYTTSCADRVLLDFACARRPACDEHIHSSPSNADLGFVGAPPEITVVVRVTCKFNPTAPSTIQKQPASRRRRFPLAPPLQFSPTGLLPGLFVSTPIRLCPFVVSPSSSSLRASFVVRCPHASFVYALEVLTQNTRRGGRASSDLAHPPTGCRARAYAYHGRLWRRRPDIRVWHNHDWGRGGDR